MQVTYTVFIKLSQPRNDNFQSKWIIMDQNDWNLKIKNPIKDNWTCNGLQFERETNYNEKY